MSKHIEIKEKFSRYWPAVAVLSGVMAVILFGAYFYVSDVLYEGYLRLGAFGFFALSFLSFFKIYDGQITIEATADQKEGLLLFSYSIRDRVIHEEEISLKDISELKITEMPNRSLYNDFFTNDRTVRFKRNDSPGWLYLNEIYGRIVPLTQENAESLKGFVEKQKK